MIFDREPVAILAVIRAAVVLGVAFGLHFTVDQIAAIYLITEAILSLIARQTVTAPANLPDAE